MSNNLVNKYDSKYENKYDPNIYFDKIFIINLDKCRDRWRKIKNNLEENGIYNYERQPGVQLPRVDPFKHINSRLYLNFEAYGGKYKNDKNYILNVVGGNMAHFQIIRKSIARNYNRIMVLEDDSFLNRNFKINFSEGVSKLSHWDLLYLGFKKSQPKLPCRKVSRELIQPFGKIRGAYGYAVNKSIFPYLLRAYLYNGMEIDVFYEYYIINNKRVYAFFPQIVGHRDKLQSTITHRNWK